LKTRKESPGTIPRIPAPRP